jgi:hypothetical protein
MHENVWIVLEDQTNMRVEMASKLGDGASVTRCGVTSVAVAGRVLFDVQLDVDGVGSPGGLIDAFDNSAIGQVEEFGSNASVRILEGGAQRFACSRAKRNLQ